MLTSPITVTIDGVAHSLSRINQDNYSSVYFKKAAGVEYKLVIRHSYEGKNGPSQYERHNVDLTVTTWDAEGTPSTVQAYMVFRSVRGTDAKGSEDVTKALSAFMTANVAAIAGWAS